VCGFAFAKLLIPEEESARPERDPGTVTLVSLAMPGAGHAYLGMWGQAIARAVLTIWVVAVAVFAVLSAGPGSLFISALFGLAAFGLWLVAAHDAYREATHNPQAVLLRDRYFLYVVLGLLFLLMIVVFAAAFRAAG